jgi:protein-S-isoprenylcysteine O-methyltransferase Ste14
MSADPSTPGTRVPSLGPRGEGWVAGQVVLFGVIFLGGFAGGAWQAPAASATLVVGAILVVFGGLQALRGLLDLGSNLSPLPHPRPSAELVERGIYARVRHPIYGGLICGGFGWGLATASWVALLGAVLLAVWFSLKSRREEAWLLERYPGYAAYRARTARFVVRFP